MAQGDKVYNNRLVTKLINGLMKDGKKGVAENVVYDTFAKIADQKKEDPIAIFEKALQTIGPRQEVKARRVGGASYQIPMEVRGDRRMALAIRWLIEAATKRSSKDYRSFPDKLTAEILDALENRGDAIKKRDTILRMAEANKAFAHFRW